MRAGCVIDAVSATACGAALQPSELGCEARQVEQLRLSAVQEREQVAVDVALGFLGRGVFDPMHPETLAWPLAAIAVARHLADAVTLQQLRELHGDVVRRERRTAFTDSVEDRAAI